MIMEQELSTARSLAPLLSEGAISPFQVSNMSKREKAERDKNIQIRYKLEYQYEKENMTDKEKREEKQEEIIKEIESLKTKIESTKRIILYHKELGAFQSKRMNDTKRAVLFDEDEIKKLGFKIKELEGRFKLIMDNEKLIADDNKILIGKRARFKNREDYVKKVWNKEGIIVTSDQTKYLYLQFDEPVTSGFNDGAVTESLVICRGSIDLI